MIKFIHSAYFLVLVQIRISKWKTKDSRNPSSSVDIFHEFNNCK